MAPFVLVHGGGLDRRCWDRLLPHLEGPALAVDLPGRGEHPAPLESVGLDDCARSVVSDVDAAGFDDVVLVGHSLAGCSMPGMIGLLGDRVQRAVFIACTVPEDGASAFDTLDPEIQRMIREAPAISEPRPMDAAMAKVVLGNDLDEEAFSWCVERLVPEAPRLTEEPVDLSPLERGVPCSWIRTIEDLIVEPAKQLRFARNVGDCPVIDLDAGHMCMVGKPTTLARLLNELQS
jgi:pimeloyl-ACP methyl ester carboxylesterase